MSATRTCAGCGTEIGGDAPSGHCPACLMRLGLGAVLEAGTPDELTPGAGASRRFGDYELLELLGRGGMGVVYRARQISLDRLVALKMIGHAHLTSPLALQRFQTEAETAAKLDHPNIVPIYEVGEHDGQPFFSMKLVEGRSLADAIKSSKCEIQNEESRRRPGGERAPVTVDPFGISNFEFLIPLLATLARAVHYAHQHGVLHRDLKPGNILLDGQGTPYLTDFGVAKVFGVPPSGGTGTGGPAESGTPNLTLTGSVLGTPSYMAPEQATGGRASTASDIYSLGAILYELLTGRPPFHASTPLETLRQVTEQEPTPPTTFNALIPRDLATICLKCLEKEPAKRYASAEALAEDLERFTRDEPIQARPVGQAEKFTRWCRRNPKLATSLGALVLALGLGISGILSQWHRAESNATNERRERYYASIGVADAHIRNGDIDVALNVLTNCPPEFRHWEWGRLLYLCHQYISTARYADTNVDMVALSDDGKRLCLSVHRNVVCWDLESRRKISGFGLPDGYDYQMVLSPDSRHVAVAREDGVLQVWDIDTGRERSSFAISNRVEFISFQPDAPQLWITTVDRRSTLRDIDTGKVVSVTPEVGDRLISSALDPLRNNWFTMDTRGTIAVRDLRTGAIRAHIQAAPFYSPLMFGGSTPLVVSPDGRWLMANRSPSSARIWDTQSGEEVANIPSRMYKAVFSPDGRTVATLSGNKTVDLWAVATGAKILTLQGHEDWVITAGFSPDERQITTVDNDGVVKTWNADASRERFDHDGPVDAVAFSPDGRRFVTTQMDGFARIWETESGRELRAWRGNWSWCRAARFSPDGRRIITAGADRIVRIWDAKGGIELLALRGHTSAVRDALFSPDGTMVATASWDKTCRLWDAQTGKALHTLTAHTQPVGPIVFSPDGQRLATAGHDGIAYVWDRVTGRQVLALKASSTVLSAIAISPDGQRIVTGSRGRSIRIWDSKTGENVAVWKTRSMITWLHFSADGRRLVVLASDSGAFDAFPSVDVWDAETGRQILALPGHTSLIGRAEFSPDGQRLLTGCRDRTARLWEAFPWQEEAYVGNSQLSLPERIRNYADGYWRARVAAEGTSIRATRPAVTAESLRIPRSAWPSRDPGVGAHLIDLSEHYNALLDLPAYGIDREAHYDNDLSAVPTGTLTLSNVQFDVRGKIILRSTPRPLYSYSVFEERFLTDAVRGIRVNAKFRRFHLLHAMENSDYMVDDTLVCSYVLHYADGQQREVEILFGRDVRDWWYFREESNPLTDRGAVVWRGVNPLTTRSGTMLRLYKTTFENPRPEVEVQSMDFVSKLARCNPFLIALTVEP